MMGIIGSNKKMAVTEDTTIPVETYSIGVFEGTSPFDLSPSTHCENPILNRQKIPNGNVNFVADPFAIYHDELWYLFYEKMEIGTRKGKICVTTSKDGFFWEDSHEILEEPFHLSYPQVFWHEGEHYMIPESYEANEIRLYKSTRFPFEWRFEKVILPISSVDATIFFEDGMWWLFVCDSPKEHDRLRLFYAQDLYGDWIEHRQSPIREHDNQGSRPAGKLVKYQNKIYRFAQDCALFYGHSVRAFEIERLSTSEYKERALESNPILEGGDANWNQVSMHHIDLHEIDKNHWIAFVDGRAH